MIFYDRGLWPQEGYGGRAFLGREAYSAAVGLLPRPDAASQMPRLLVASIVFSDPSSQAFRCRIHRCEHCIVGPVQIHGHELTDEQVHEPQCVFVDLEAGVALRYDGL